MQREFSDEHRSVAAARRFVSAVLTEWDAEGFDWVATTVVSEMATNAVLHARTPYSVSLHLSDELLRIAVSDASPRMPQRRAYGPDATTGRGLSLIRALAEADGVDATGTTKTVWCQLRADGSSGAGSDVDSDQLTGAATGTRQLAELPTSPGGPGPTSDDTAARHDLGAGPATACAA